MFKEIFEWTGRIEENLVMLLHRQHHQAKINEERHAELAHDLRRVVRRLNFMTGLEIKMSKEMDDLVAEVASETAGDDAIVAAINGLQAQIVAAGTDPAKLAELTASLKANAARIAAAVALPAGSPPPPPPVEPPVTGA